MFLQVGRQVNCKNDGFTVCLFGFGSVNDNVSKNEDINFNEF